MRKTWLIFSQAVTVAVAVLFVLATLKPDWLQRSNGNVLPGVVSIVQAPATKLAVVTKEPAAQLARVFNAYAEKDAA